MSNDCFRCITSNIENEMRFPALEVPVTDEGNETYNSKNNKDKSPSNPQRGEYPDPTPVNNTTQFQDNEGDSEQTAEANTVFIVSLIFHFFFLPYQFLISSRILRLESKSTYILYVPSSLYQRIAA